MQEIIWSLRLLASVAMCVFPEELVLRAPFLPCFFLEPSTHVNTWKIGRS